MYIFVGMCVYISYIYIYIHVYVCVYTSYVFINTNNRNRSGKVWPKQKLPLSKIVSSRFKLAHLERTAGLVYERVLLSVHVHTPSNCDSVVHVNWPNCACQPYISSTNFCVSSKWSRWFKKKKKKKSKAEPVSSRLIFTAGDFTRSKWSHDLKRQAVQTTSRTGCSSVFESVK